MLGAFWVFFPKIIYSLQLVHTELTFLNFKEISKGILYQSSKRQAKTVSTCPISGGGGRGELKKKSFLIDEFFIKQFPS